MVGRAQLQNGVVLAGIGRTNFSRSSGRSTLHLAAEAISNALADAGLERDSVDGVFTFHMNDSVTARDVVTAMGLGPVHWWGDTQGGGSVIPAVFAQASMMVACGAARHVVIYRSMNGRSGKRIGRSGQDKASGDAQFLAPFGFGAAPQMFAMVARRHMHTYGTTREQLGHVAMTMRRHASTNPGAMMRKTLTMEGYLSSRMISDPFCLNDCCVEVDGAVAVVLSAASRKDMNRHRSVRVTSIAHGGSTSPRLLLDRWPDFSNSAFPEIAKRLYRGAQMTADDIDVALIYDAFTFEVLQQLEDFDFCLPGESGPFVAEGNIAASGAIPVNPHGGLLSEGYLHGLNHVYEAVIQLRGDAGVRQIERARTALVTSFGFSCGGAMILENDQ